MAKLWKLSYEGKFWVFFPAIMMKVTSPIRSRNCCLDFYHHDEMNGCVEDKKEHAHCRRR